MRSKKFLGGRPELSKKEKSFIKKVPCPTCSVIRGSWFRVKCSTCNNTGYIKQKIKEL